MKQVKKGKRKLGAGYSYKKYMGEKQIARLKKQPPYGFVEQRVASLTAGCVRIDAVLFRSTTGFVNILQILRKLRRKGRIHVGSLVREVTNRNGLHLRIIDRGSIKLIGNRASRSQYCQK